MNTIFFFKDEWNKLIKKNNDAFSHIKNILKPQVGDYIKVGLVEKGRGLAKVLQLEDDYIKLQFPNQIKEDKKQLEINLFLGLVRPIVLKRILKSLAIFSVKNIILFSAELSEKSYLQSELFKNEKYKKYFLKGIEQGNVSFMPNLFIKKGLKNALKENKEDGYSIFLNEFEEFNNFYKIDKKIKNVVIGPERGFTENEIFILKDFDFEGAFLTKRTLSFELACISSVSFLAKDLG